MRFLRLVPALALGLIAIAAPASAAAPLHGHHPYQYNYDCTGGNVPAGTYGTLTISGVCTATTGSINVRGDVNVQNGALFDDITAGDGPANPQTSSLTGYAGLAPAGTPLISATIDVGGDIWVGKGAALLLGCSPDISCPEGITTDTVDGSINAYEALGVVVHSTQIGGNVSLIDGGNGVAGAAACTTVPAPWSEDTLLTEAQLPVYSDLEEDVIGGSVTINGQESCWQGVLRNEVGGNLWFNNNVMGDPDGNEVGNNLVTGSMGCIGNSPGTPPPPTPMSTGVQFGDSGAGPSIVGGQAYGQCGFNVTTLNPPPEAGEGPGIPEHLTVPAWSLHRYSGWHIDVSTVAQAELATTSTGNVLTGELNNAKLTGWGLTGAISISSATTYDGSGESVFGTQFPDGWSTFRANDICACTFQGQSGTISIRAFGTTAPSGYTWGTFLISSGGAASGGLGTLAGWGTFRSAGKNSNVLAITEYLAIT
jgi:hypothetical protein